MTARGDARSTALAEVAAIAAAYAGVQASMLDRQLLRKAVDARMKACRIAHADEYAALCRADEGEQLALAESTLNGETSFFRDRGVFEELTAWCVARLERVERIAILSAPCSTGEEPYSIAAALLDAGVEAERFAVDAVEISPRSIAHAERGMYGAMSLRGVPEEHRAKFVEREAHGWRVTARVRERVRFRQGNLMQAGVLRDARYDLIASRNLMLYQSATARSQLAAVLAGALMEDGRLVMGSADWGRDLEPWFALVKPARSFAATHRAVVSAPAMETTAPKPERKKVARPVVPVAVKAMLPSSAEEELARTAQLYREALEAHMGAHDRRAEQLCRSVLYMDPEFLPALELLAKIHRPHVTGRVRAALAARLARRRARAVAKGGNAA